jgi:hypothetical protein
VALNRRKRHLQYRHERDCFGLRVHRYSARALPEPQERPTLPGLPYLTPAEQARYDAIVVMRHALITRPVGV